LNFFSDFFELFSSELLAAFAEEQAKLLGKKKSKKGKKKKKSKQMGEQLAQLEEMMAKLEEGDNDIDISAAQETLKLLEEKPKKSKKKKKEKLPAPFSAEALIDPAVDEELNDLPPELLEELKNYEPTEEEIAAEFELLKKQEEQKRKKKVKMGIFSLKISFDKFRFLTKVSILDKSFNL